MKYIIIEIQKFSDGTVAVPPIHTADSFFEASSTFHSICATAAVSDVPVHSAVLMNETGQTYGLESFNHINEQTE